MSNETLAEVVAQTAHAAVGQVRKYTFEPYIVHPIHVASIVSAYGGSTEQIQAAYLHDVVEDTEIDIEFISSMFGDKVATLVGWLTDVSVPEDGNRETRKRIDREHTAAAPYEAQFVKIADLISNTSSILEADEKFAKVYMKEKELMLGAMTKVHGTDIYNEAMKILEEYYKGHTQENQ